MATSGDRVKLNVGGKTFETTMTTLARAGTGSSLYASVRDQLNLGAEIFIDRNPDYFAVLLELLRTGHLDIPEGMTKHSVYQQAKLYGLEGCIRAATRGGLDGNLLQLSHSMTSSPCYEGDLIRASPAGGFCLGQQDVLRTYNDWNLKEEHPSICVRDGYIDAVWCDSRNIAISSPRTMKLYDSVTGKSSHSFYQRVPSRRPIGNLCTNSSKEIFSAYTVGNHTEVGAWDQVTGRLKRIVATDHVRSDTTKLLWVSGINCLLQASDDYSLRFVDPRTTQVVSKSNNINSPDRKRMADAAVNEMSSNICLVDQLMNIGFLDYRKLWISGKDVQWVTEYADSNGTTGDSDSDSDYNPEEPIQPADYPRRLLCHEGQLFAQRGSSVSVFTTRGSELSRTRMLGESDDAVQMRDISIGGDRLFTLHTDADGLDEVNVWETPRQ